MEKYIVYYLVQAGTLVAGPFYSLDAASITKNSLNPFTICWTKIAKSTISAEVIE